MGRKETSRLNNQRVIEFINIPFVQRKLIERFPLAA